MTATNLPADVQQVFDRFVTTEYVTVDRRGQPIVWPVTPYWHASEGCVDVTTGIGYPKKADDAQRNPRVALLFSDATGSGLDDPPMVLVQGIAEVDDRDLQANARRFARESAAKLPAFTKQLPPGPLSKLIAWYTNRIYVHVRPERVFLWHGADPRSEPELLDSHLEEVRSGHSEEPEEGHAPPDAVPPIWNERLAELGTRYPTAAVAIVGPDGFPFATRVPVRADPAARLVHIEAETVGAPLEPGLACLVAHEHAPDFSWQRNFQVRGDLVETDTGWALAPHRVVGGTENPPSLVGRLRANARKSIRWTRTARREHARRSAR
jgi:hypothetical protein